MADRSFGDFDALARQYWNQWGEMMRGANAHATPAAPAMPGWNDAIGWWSKMAAGGLPEADIAVGRFERQAGDWFGRIQQLAAGFIGQSPAAADVADAWKKMLGGAGANPFADMFASMGGQGQQGFDQWFEQVAPFISALQGEGRSMLGMPTFGFSREHQERWQRIARLQADYQARNQACQKLMIEAGQRAFGRFEEKLATHAEPGRQLTSARALFDVWIDAAEDAYAEIAMSPAYQADFGEMVNAQMRLRGALQNEIERVADLIGVPSRTEVDSAHRKIVQLERDLRYLRERLESATASAEPAPAPARRPAARQSSTSTPGRIDGKTAAATRTSAKPGPRSSTARRAKTVPVKAGGTTAKKTRASTAKPTPPSRKTAARSSTSTKASTPAQKKAATKATGKRGR